MPTVKRRNQVAFALAMLALGTFLALVLTNSVRAQGAQSLEALKKEANEACAMARDYQEKGRDAHRRSQNPNTSEEARAVAQREVSILHPLFVDYRDLCLAKKREYYTLIGSTPGGDINPLPSDLKVSYVGGRYICSDGFVCPYKSVCMLGECAPGVEKNDLWLCTGYGCKLEGDSCSCAARYLGKECCTRK